MQKILIGESKGYGFSSYENEVNRYLESGWKIKDIKIDSKQDPNGSNVCVIVTVLEYEWQK